jgi:hypothetical protein
LGVHYFDVRTASGATMAAKSPGIVAVLEKPLYQRIEQAARAEGVSLSAKVRDLLREAMELEEDAYWVKEGEKRLATFRDSEALTHDEAWRYPVRQQYWHDGGKRRNVILSERRARREGSRRFCSDSNGGILRLRLRMTADPAFDAALVFL